MGTTFKAVVYKHRWVYSLGASGADGVFTVQATVCTLNSDGTLTLETYLLG